MASGAKDKRRHERMKPRGVLAHVSGGGKQFSSNVDNLSAGGLFLRTEQMVPRGTTLHLDLVKPGGRRTLHVQGRVVGVLEPDDASAQRMLPGLGVEFAEVGPEEVERLEALLQALGVSGSDAVIPPTALPGARPSATRAEAETILRDIATSLGGQEEPARALGAPSTLPRIAAEPARPAPSTPPIAGAPQQEAPPPPPRPGPAAGEQERLMLQIRGLLFELGETKERLRTREAEILDLRAQLDDARTQIEALEKEAGSRRRA
jgi:uncharacterized protein (TIGR02266 family)